jgi:predicted transcriptional regulator
MENELIMSFINPDLFLKEKFENKETTKKEKIWNINLPTANFVLSNKKEFSYEVLIALLLESNFDNKYKESHRYIYDNNVNFTQLSKKAGVSLNTFKKYFKNLIELKVIKETEFKDEKVYKIPQKFAGGYLLFEAKFLEKLLSLSHKNLIRIYIQYYKYCYQENNTKIYKMSQSKTLTAIGMSVNAKNKDYLKKANRLLEELGLIEIVKVKHKSGTPLQIKCPLYKDSKFYKEIINKE